MPRENTKALLAAIVAMSRAAMNKVAEAFQGDWRLNPGTGTRAALGKWLVTAMRHLSAICILSEEHDLSTVAHVHHRQIFEIMLQVRKFAQADRMDHERLAERISACGCLQYLHNLEPVKNHPQVQPGYKEMAEQLTKYDSGLVAKIKSESASRRRNWFGTTYTDLATKVSKPGEDLAAVYRIVSGELHGVWDLAIGVANPAPGIFDFRGYPDLETMYRWATDRVDVATQWYVQIWNEVAVLVGADEVMLDLVSPPRNLNRSSPASTPK